MPPALTFRYDPANHHVGALTVMSFKAPKVPATSGASVIRNYLNYLAHHPCTATHLATKLAIRFVSDDPPAGLVSRLAKTYLEHDTAITPVLKQLFTSPEIPGFRRAEGPPPDRSGRGEPADSRLFAEEQQDG